MKAKFNISYIDGLKPRDKRYEVQDTLFPHLTIRVSPSGVKSYYILYRDSSKILRRVKIGDARIITPTQARETAQMVLAEITTTGVDPRDKGEKEEPTLQYLVDMYREAGKSDVTASFVLRDYRDWLRRPVSTIKQVDIEMRREERRKSTKNTFATINRSVGALQAVLNWAALREIIVDNPARNLRKLKEIDSMTQTRYLTDSERERLDRVLEKHYATNQLRFAVVVSLNTGMRKGSLLGLRWSDVDFPTRHISLRPSIVKGKKAQIIPMNAACAEALLMWKKLQKVDRLDRVFPEDNSRNSWETALKKANIKNFRWHDMRHDFASQLVMKGVDLNTVRELLGHGDIKMTMRYAHLSKNVKSNAVDLLGKP